MNSNRSSGWTPQDLLIGAVGNIRTPKAYDVLLEAAASVLARLPHCHFAVIGEGQRTAPCSRCCSSVPGSASKPGFIFSAFVKARLSSIAASTYLFRARAPKACHWRFSKRWQRAAPWWPRAVAALRKLWSPKNRVC